MLLEHLRRDPSIAQAHMLAQAFQRMVRQRQPGQFDAWFQQCRGAEAPELGNFAAGMQREEAAIRAALSAPWSTGPVEGQVTRLKSIKRQMYGRANVDLLRLRVLHRD